ncbi:MAG: LysM peptidoglycan-binding domain-containing protein [Fibrobacterota bacterium]
MIKFRYALIFLLPLLFLPSCAKRQLITETDRGDEEGIEVEIPPVSQEDEKYAIAEELYNDAAFNIEHEMWAEAESKLEQAEDIVRTLIATSDDTASITLYNILLEEIIAANTRVLLHIEDLSDDASAEVLTDKLGIDSSLIDVEDSLHVRILSLIDTSGYDIPISVNRKVINCIKFFMTTGREPMEKWLSRATAYMPVIDSILRSEDMPVTLKYLPMIESGYNPRAYSRAGASGFWQFISATGRRFGMDHDYWYDERRDLIKATHGAIKYLRKLNNEFDDWWLSLASYNCGENRIRRIIRKTGNRDYWKMHSLPRETRSYVPLFCAASLIGRSPEKFGFDSIPKRELFRYDTVFIDFCLDLDKAAEFVGISYSEIKDFNPEIMRWCTPPTKGRYTLKIPAGSSEKFKKKLAGIDKKDKVSWVRYKVRRGDALSLIANRYGVSLSALKSINKIRGTRIWTGQHLLIPIKSGSSPPKATARAYRKSRSAFSKPEGRKPVYHTIKPGNTMSEIAELYNVGLSELRRWNGLRKGSRIYVGRRLKVYPPTGYKSVSSGGNVVHTVKRGENLSLIADQYRVSLSDVLKRNDLDMDSRINPGEKIVISGQRESSGKSEGHEQAVTSYIVKGGDNLWNIASDFGVSIHQIKKWNNKRGNSIFPGEKLNIYSDAGKKNRVARKVPEKKSVSAIETAGGDRSGDLKHYTVRSGDNIIRIASKLRVRGKDLLDWNNMTKNSTIYPGQKLKYYSSSDKSEYYTVRPGDNLWEISRKFDVSISGLKRANGISGYSIKPGQRLEIVKERRKVDISSDESGAQRSSSPKTVSYVVKSGDNLWQIARSYNVHVDDIVRHNNLDDKVIKPGMKLKIKLEN